MTDILNELHDLCKLALKHLMCFNRDPSGIAPEFLVDFDADVLKAARARGVVLPGRKTPRALSGAGLTIKIHYRLGNPTVLVEAPVARSFRESAASLPILPENG